VARSFAEPLSECDAVVACIALHHVKDMAAKGAIYANIHRALRPGGLFANADFCMSAQARVREATYRGWAKFMHERGYSAKQTAQYFENWAKEDYYPPLAMELGLLSDAGFAGPECWWRAAPVTVFGGVK